MFNTNLTSITIPSCIEFIGPLAFYGCPRLTNVTIGSGVTTIGGGAFLECNNLTAINVDPLNPVYQSIDGVLYSKDGTVLIQCPGGKTGSCTVSSNVTTIETWAFSSRNWAIGVPYFENPIFPTKLGAINVDPDNPNYSSDNGVLFDKGKVRLIRFPGGKSGFYPIPDGVQVIDAVAFSDCIGLTGVAIPKSTQDLGPYCFYGCTSLTNVTIPHGPWLVMVGSFARCSSLTQITLPSTIRDIESWAFAYCPSLTSLYTKGDAPDGAWNSGIFLGTENATVYYIPQTYNWGPTYGGRPTAPYDIRVQELWEYASGPAGGLNGGRGFAGPYSGFASVADGSLAYTDGNGIRLETSGGRLQTHGANNGVFRQLFTDFGDVGTTIYVSFLASLTSGDGTGYGGLSLFDGDTERLFIGDPGYGTFLNWGIDVQEGESSSIHESSYPVDSTTRLFVVRIDFGSGWAWTTLYVDPPLDTEQDIPHFSRVIFRKWLICRLG